MYFLINVKRAGSLPDDSTEKAREKTARMLD
jgi:hypothetical protein